ncbi:MAG: ribonuclease III [Clostridiales bacterium]|nr:ribonuclease III [Clostridiales bacterium]
MQPFSPCLPPEKARLLSPLQLAFVGDSVHALLARTRLMQVERRMNDMHKLATRQVNAVSQHQALEKLLPHLTEDEKDIVRRGRNAHSKHGIPKSATVEDYSAATALEALYGYLFMSGQMLRLKQIDDICYQEDL